MVCQNVSVLISQWHPSLVQVKLLGGGGSAGSPWLGWELMPLMWFIVTEEKLSFLTSCELLLVCCGVFLAFCF